LVRLNIAYSQIGQHITLLRHVLEKVAVLRTCRQLRQLAVFLGTLSVLRHDAHWARPCASHDIESRVESSQSACQAARETLVHETVVFAALNRAARVHHASRQYGGHMAARSAQQSKNIPTVGVLWHAGSAEEEDVYLTVLVKTFNDLGYIEGKNIHLDHRFPAENPERFRTLARELVEAKPDIIIAVTLLGALELKKATSTIPIVFVLVPDPIGSGLAESLARPGAVA
jgi:hypothetical protein